MRSVSLPSIVPALLAAGAAFMAVPGKPIAVSGELPPGTATWRASESPYRVTGRATIPAAGTLVIEPGVTVLFDEGAGLVVRGRLTAAGNEKRPVRMTLDPASGGTWKGVFFEGTRRENLLDSVAMSGAVERSYVRADDSDVRLRRVTWRDVDPRRGILDLRGATSFDVAGCIFPDLDHAEPVHYEGRVPVGGFAILRGNRFGGTRGYNDVVDISNAKAPGPLLQVIDNEFAGGGDDILDLDGTDAWIEGNVFHGAHATDPLAGLSAAISGGERGGEAPVWTVVRNFFYDLDHVALLKEGAFATFVNNTAVNCSKGGIAFFEAGRIDFGRSRSVGKGAILDGNIFWKVGPPFLTTEANGIRAEIAVRHSILDVPTAPPGPGNSNADPRLKNPDKITKARVDLALRPGPGPARGKGPNGVDMGAAVPAGASVSGVPASPTGSREATLLVGGPQFTSYRYRLNEGGWSREIPVSRPIRLTALADGRYRVSVIVKNAAGAWQSESNATTTNPWTVAVRARPDGLKRGR